MNLLWLLLLPVVDSLRTGTEANQEEWTNQSSLSRREDCKIKLQEDYCCSSRKNNECTDGKRSLCDEEQGMHCSFGWKGYECRCKGGTCYHADLKMCMKKEELEILTKAKGKPMYMRVEDAFESLFGFMGGAFGTVVGTAFTPFRTMAKHGAMYFAGSFAKSRLNNDIQSVEEWLHYVMATFVLDHDDAPKAFCNKASSLSIGNAKVDYGKCFLSLAYPDGVPLWAGPIYSYGDGRGNDFNISLSVKANQIRCLDKLQVQKSRCFGNMIADGGLCQLELSPTNDCPLNVTDLEIEIYCEGRCQVGDHIKSMLSWGEADNAIDIGRKVRIYKENSKLYNQKCKGEIMTITRNLVRCDGDGKHCLRHCLENQEGKSKGCWHAKNLLTEKYCESWWKTGARKILNRLGSWVSTETSESRVTLLYRKFNAILREVKVRTDVYIFRTRSLLEAIEEDADDKRNSRTKSSISRSFENAFGSLKQATFGMIMSEKNATKEQMDLIKKYNFNMQPKRDEKGNFQGYEMVTCKWPTWNNETQAYDLPPLKKCQKIRLVNLQVLASEENYLEIEEKSSSQDVKPSVSGGSPGLVLSLVTKIARMMFVRHTATISAPDGKGEGRFCKDMWTPGKTPEKSYAVGVECKAQKTGEFYEGEDEDEVGDGVDARLEFEFVELQPVWNEEKKKNQQLIGIRGGYNLQWCRVLSEASEKKTNLKAGSVVCDLELPLQEGTNRLLNATLPIEAQFRLEQTGKNDIPSNVIISSDASQDTCDGNCEADEEKTKEEVSEELFDAAGVEQTLEIRLMSMMTQKYCKTTLQSFKKWNGLRTTKKILLACDTDTEASEHNLLSLWGSTDGLTPSKYWNFIIVLSLSCLGGTIGFTGSSWASLLGGVGVVFTFASTLVGTAAGVAGGIYFTDYLTNSYHIDGIMLRYMMNDKLQTVGQQILYLIESVLDFEFPRP